MTTNNQNQIQAFGFGDSLVRTVAVNGESWFVARDVCACLDIDNNRDALSRLADDEKGVATTDTLGGRQEVAIISEAGLYRLIFTSRKTEAETFRRWVTHEVLPTIRKTGGYGVQPAASTEEIAQRAADIVMARLAVQPKRRAVTAMIKGTAPARYPSAVQWLRECCRIINDEAISNWTPAGVAYAHYCDWCRACGVRPLHVRHVKAVVVESGATARKSSGVFYSLAILPLSTDGRAE